MSNTQLLEEEIERINELLQVEEISGQQKHYLKQVLLLIKSEIKIGIFNEVLLSNASKYETLIAALDEKISKYKQAQEDVKLSSYPHPHEFSYTTDKYIHYLEEFKQKLLERNFKGIATDLAIEAQSNQIVIDALSMSLGNGYMEFSKFFDGPLVENPAKNKADFIINPTEIDKVFDIISNDELYEEISDYINLLFEKEKSLSRTKEMTKRAENLEYALTHFEEATEYSKKKDYEILDQETESEYISDKEVLELINRSKIFKLLCEKHIKQLKARIEAYEKNSSKLEKIKNLEKNDPEYCRMLEGFYLVWGSIFPGEKMCEKFSESLESVNESISKNDAYIEGLDSKILDRHSKLSEQAKKLVDQNLTACQNIVQLVNAKERYDLIPIISAYLLKTICDSRKLEWNEVLSITQSSINIEKLKEYYQECIDQHLESKKHAVEHIETKHDKVVESLYESDGRIR